MYFLKKCDINYFFCGLFIIASHFDLRWSSHIMVLWILIMLYDLYKNKQLNLIKKYYMENKTYVNSILAFFMLPFFAVVLHGFPGKELSEWASQFRGEIIGVLVPFLLLKNKISIKKVLLLSIVMVNVSMFYGYYKYILLHYFNLGPDLNPAIATGNAARLSAFITTNPNVYSLYLLILFCIVFYASYYLKGYKFLCVFTLVNIFVSLVIGMSRGCILLFFASVIIFVIYKLRKNLKALIAALCIICVSFGGVLLASPSFANRIVSTIKDSRIDSHRYVIYSTSINIIKDNWFSGLGKGNLKENFEKYNEHKDITNKTFYRAHQIVLDMMINSGIFGLFAFLYFIISQFKVFIIGYLKNNADSIKKYAALMCIFITGIVFTYMQVENAYYALRRIYWIYIGVGYYILIRNTNKKLLD